MNTLRHSRISLELFEALQVIKFSYICKQSRLTFTEEFIAKPQDYTIAGPVSQAAMTELEGCVELLDLFDNAGDEDYFNYI